MSKQSAEAPAMARVVERNITALIKRRKALDRRKPWQERLSDRITKFAGSMLFVGLHLVIYGLWIIINLGWIPGVPRFDPTFVVLAMEASVEAIFLSTFVLISQNRMQAEADKRADLDLQISLLAEHEITRLVQLVSAMASRMGSSRRRVARPARTQAGHRARNGVGTHRRSGRETGANWTCPRLSPSGDSRAANETFSPWYAMCLCPPWTVSKWLTMRELIRAEERLLFARQGHTQSRSTRKFAETLHRSAVPEQPSSRLRGCFVRKELY